MKYSKEALAKIHALVKSGTTVKGIAELYGIKYSTAHSLCKKAECSENKKGSWEYSASYKLKKFLNESGYAKNEKLLSDVIKKDLESGILNPKKVCGYSVKAHKELCVMMGYEIIETVTEKVIKVKHYSIKKKA